MSGPGKFQAIAPGPERARASGPLRLALLVAVCAFAVLSCNQHAAPPADSLRVDVIAHLWWWEFRYLGTTIVTADEMHVPAGRSVWLSLHSANDPEILAVPDRAHGFYLPDVGMVEVIPDAVSHMLLRIDRPGRYPGQCSEFCGAGHTKMRFVVIVDPPDRFAAWEHGQEQIAVTPRGHGPAARGARLFASGLCTTCHAVAGVSKGSFGPNLTHFGSRSRLAGASFDNTPANLKEWISNPGKLKPQVHMPALGLRGTDLDDMAAYLENLK